MDKKKLTAFTLGFGILILVIVLLFARSTTRRAGRIELPEADSGVQGEGTDPTDDPSALELVEITPDTVQLAVAQMSRMETYSRNITVETYWDGGSSTANTQTYVRGETMRMDTTRPDGSVRHLLTNGETTCIWYDDASAWTAFSAGAFTADAEQSIPTYETILSLEKEQIAQASYGSYEDLYCIMVVTAQDEDGYVTTYWISTETGLLVAAETTQEDVLVYRMTALTLDAVSPEDTVFQLPDGSTL